MGYYGGTSGDAGSGHYELLHANEGVLRIEDLSFADTIETIALPADMTSIDRLDIMLRVWRIGGSASPDFAEFYPWLGSDGGSAGFLWPNCDTSSLHYMAYRIDSSQGNGLVCALDQRNGGTTDPNFWTSTDNTFADMGALAGETLGLSCTGYLMSPGYFDWGWAWSVHLIRTS